MVQAPGVELGYELLAGVPWAADAHRRGELRATASVDDSAPFYAPFSPLHCERAGVGRRYLPVAAAFPGSSWPVEAGAHRLITAAVRASSFEGPGAMPGWRMPPFFGYYCGWGLLPTGGTRYILIFNKRNLAEWGGPPVNSLPPPTLVALFLSLAPRHTIIYMRATPGLHASEPSGFAQDEGDCEALRAAAVAAYGQHAVTDGHPEQRLLLLPWTLRALQMEAADEAEAYGRRRPTSPAPHPISFNTILLSALADADGLIAVQGGPAYLSLLWGPGKHIILFQLKGAEVDTEAVRWFHLLSGADSVRSTNSTSELLLLARDRWG